MRRIIYTNDRSKDGHRQRYCMGVSITVNLSTSFRENLEDLFEALLGDGYNTEF